MLRFPVALDQVATEVSPDRLKDVFQPGQVGIGEDRRRYFVTKTKWACSRKTQCLPVRMSLVCPMDQIWCVVCSSDTAIGWTQPQHSVRRSPERSGAPGWSTTTGSGCVRTRTGPGCRLSGGVELSRQVVTLAKQTPERAWLGEVSAVALQQSLADLDRAYRN